MAEIISKEPFKKDNRSQQLVKFDDGTERVRCFNPLASPYYFNKGKLEEVDSTHTELTGLSIDDCQLRNKGIMSVGIRQSGELNKFLGFRPDTTQHAGEEQIEFSLKKIVIDEYTRTDDLSKLDTVDNKTTDLGDIVIQSTQSRTRQLIKIPEATSSVEAHYEIDLKNVHFKNEFKPLENELFLKGQRTNFANFGTVDPAGWDRFTRWRKSEKSNKGFDIALCMPNFDLLLIANRKWIDEFDTEYDIDIDKIPSQFITHERLRTDWVNSEYLNGVICGVVKNIPEVHGDDHDPIGWFKTEFVEKVIKPLAEKSKKIFTVSEIAAPESLQNVGQAYRKGVSAFVFLLNGVPFGVLRIGASHEIVFTIGTKDINQYNYLWKDEYKVAGTMLPNLREEVTYLDLTYKEVSEKIRNFMESFNYPEIRITGDYAVPEGYNTFKILNNENKCILKLVEPGLFDEDFNRMDHRSWLPSGESYETLSESTLHEEQNTLQITHTLKKISDTKYEYIKYARETNPLSTIMQSATYLDAETVYGDTDDYTVSRRDEEPTSWTTIFEASTGNQASTQGLFTSTYAGAVREYQVSNKMTTDYRQCYRTCFYFDTTDNYWAEDITVDIYGYGGVTDGDPAHLSAVQDEFDGTGDDYSRYAGNYADSLAEVASWGTGIGVPNVFSLPDGSLAPFGITCFMLRSDYDIEKDGDTKYFSCYLSEDGSYPPCVEFTPTKHQPITIVT